MCSCSSGAELHRHNGMSPVPAIAPLICLLSVIGKQNFFCREKKKWVKNGMENQDYIWNCAANNKDAEIGGIWENFEVMGIDSK